MFFDVGAMRVRIAVQSKDVVQSLARQFLIYSTGRDIAFSDRAALNDLLARTGAKGVVRSLLHQLTQSPLFQTR